MARLPPLIEAAYNAEPPNALFLAATRTPIEAEFGWEESGPLAEWALFVLIGRADT